MQPPKVLAALVAVLGMSVASAAVEVFDQYTLTYDETVFGAWSGAFQSGDQVGFSWTVPNSVQLGTVGAGASAVFELPSFTVTVNPGWALSGPISSFLGNLVYTQVGAATTSVSAFGDLSVNGSLPVTLGGFLEKVTTGGGSGFESGYFKGEDSSPGGAFTSFSLSNGELTLATTDGTFASITAQPQNKFEFSFTAVAAPVPEPETWAMMFAGLGVMGMVARRRREQG